MRLNILKPEHISLELILIVSLMLWPTLVNAGGRQQAGDAVLSNSQGLELSKSGKYKEAIELFRQAIKRKFDYAEAHFNLGDAYLLSAQFKKAIEAYKQALKYKPDIALAHNNMGTAYFKLGEHKKAIDAFKAALRLNPKDSLTYYNLGATYLERGDRKAAIELHRTLLGIDPQVAGKLYSLIYVPTATVYDVTGNEGVKLNVTVTDQQGNPVNDAKQEDFLVFEGEDAQTISFFWKEEAPLVYALVVDNSGSFVKEIDRAVKTATSIINHNRPVDECAIIRFIDGDKIEIVQEFTTDKAALGKAIDALFIEGGQTALLDAVYLSAQKVTQYKANDGTYRRRAIILLTDGEERASYYKLEDVISYLRKLDVQVFAIQLGKGTRELRWEERTKQSQPFNLLMKLTSETGGQVYFPKSEQELSNLANQIIKTLNTQYVIGYKPTKPGKGEEYRKVRINLVETPGRDKRSIMARPGYIVPEKQ